jgi:cytoskeletal protein RodZ
MSSRTHLSIKTLRSIEEGNYEQIGAPVLVRSFLRTYCKALEIDPEPLFERYGSEILARCESLEKQRIHKVASLQRKPGKKWPVFYFLLLVAVVALSGWLLDSWIARRHAQMNTVPQPLATDNGAHEDLQSELYKREPVLSKPERPDAPSGSLQERGKDAPEAADGGNAPSATPLDSSRPDAVSGAAAAPQAANGPSSGESPPPVAEGKHRLTVEALKDTRIVLVMDGRHKEKPTLKAGESHDWDVDKSVLLLVLNPEAVRVRWDSQEVGLPAGNAGMLRVQLPAPAGGSAVKVLPARRHSEHARHGRRRITFRRSPVVEGRKDHSHGNVNQGAHPSSSRPGAQGAGDDTQD